MGAVEITLIAFIASVTALGALSLVIGRGLRR